MYVTLSLPPSSFPPFFPPSLSASLPPSLPPSLPLSLPPSPLFLPLSLPPYYSWFIPCIALQTVMRMCQINMSSPATKDIPASWAKVVSYGSLFLFSNINNTALVVNRAIDACIQLLEYLRGLSDYLSMHCIIF